MKTELHLPSIHAPRRRNWFENGDFALTTHQLFFVHTARTHRVSVHTTLNGRKCVSVTRRVECHYYRTERNFIINITKSFSVHVTLKHKHGVFKSRQCKECFLKNSVLLTAYCVDASVWVMVSWWTEGPTGEKKAAISNSAPAPVEKTGPHCSLLKKINKRPR